MKKKIFSLKKNKCLISEQYEISFLDIDLTRIWMGILRKKSKGSGYKTVSGYYPNHYITSD